MIKDLFMNSLIFLSFTLIYGSILNELSDTVIKHHYYKFILGVVGGALGVLAILNNINISGTDIIIDLRMLALLISEYIGGGVALMISAFIIAVFRVSYNGINSASITAVIIIITSLLAIMLINYLRCKPVAKWFMKLAAFWLIWTISLSILLSSNKNLINQNVSYTLLFLGVGFMEYFLLEYVKHSNEALRRYKENSTKDYLTGLNNTRTFDDLLNESFKNARDRNEKLSCLMIDIDHFKRVNDTYGHAAGDIVLKELGAILSKNCRNLDVVGRVGGEEFCVILKDCTIDGAFEIGSRIKDEVKKHNFKIDENHNINITVSVGIATYPDSVGELDALTKEADNALYIAKQTGRDKVCNNTKCII